MPAPIKSPVRIQIEKEIAEALRAEQRALTAREIYDRINSVETRDQLSSLLNHMKKKGDLVPGAPRMPDEPGGIKGRETITYLMNDANPPAPAEPDCPACAEMIAMAAGELHQGKSADIVALAKIIAAEEDDGEACIAPDPTPSAYLINDPDEDWDRAVSSTNGDELHNAPPAATGWKTGQRIGSFRGDQSTDPVIRAINRLDEPRWQEGRMHAQRLRALAESAVCAAHPDVRTWLYDLSKTIEDMAA